MAKRILSFSAEIDIVDINPFVFVPEPILNNLFEQAGRDNGPIPICGKINGKAYRQTLMKFRGAWRLYINTIMLKDSPKRIGETVKLTVQYDPADRTVKPHPKFTKALNLNTTAKKVFNAMPRSRQQELIKYISFLKTEESVDRNVKRLVDFLNGKGRFAGRDKP